MSSAADAAGNALRAVRARCALACQRRISSGSTPRHRTAWSHSPATARGSASGGSFARSSARGPSTAVSDCALPWQRRLLRARPTLAVHARQGSRRRDLRQCFSPGCASACASRSLAAATRAGAAPPFHRCECFTGLRAARLRQGFTWTPATARLPHASRARPRLAELLVLSSARSARARPATLEALAARPVAGPPPAPHGRPLRPTLSNSCSSRCEARVRLNPEGAAEPVPLARSAGRQLGCIATCHAPARAARVAAPAARPVFPPRSTRALGIGEPRFQVRRPSGGMGGLQPAFSSSRLRLRVNRVRAAARRPEAERRTPGEAAPGRIPRARRTEVAPSLGRMPQARFFGFGSSGRRTRRAAARPSGAGLRKRSRYSRCGASETAKADDAFPRPLGCPSRTRRRTGDEQGVRERLGTQRADRAGAGGGPANGGPRRQGARGERPRSRAGRVKQQLGSGGRARERVRQSAGGGRPSEFPGGGAATQPVNTRSGGRGRARRRVAAARSANAGRALARQAEEHWRRSPRAARPGRAWTARRVGLARHARFAQGQGAVETRCSALCGLVRTSRRDCRVAERLLGAGLHRMVARRRA